jgi:hypothetical protein
MRVRALAIAVTVLGLLALCLVLVTADFRDISSRSPLALLVDAELRTLSRRTDAATLHFDLVPQDGTSAAMDRLVMQPRQMTDALALARSYLVHERAYAIAPSEPLCQLPALANGCTLSLTKPGAEIQIQRQGGVLTVSKFALR